jgi:uncharacterized membrane protein (UPF0182 family)
VLPKDQNIYGPSQIDSRINQDQTISQLVTLWNQQQSKIVWGNLLIIPIDGSILYVKPMYMESESERNKQAELKKVIMVYQNQVAMGDTVADAIARLSLNGPASQPNTSSNTPTKAQPSAGEKKAAILKRIDEITRELQQLTQQLRQM